MIIELSQKEREKVTGDIFILEIPDTIEFPWKIWPRLYDP